MMHGIINATCHSASQLFGHCRDSVRKVPKESPQVVSLDVLVAERLGDERRVPEEARCTSSLPGTQPYRRAGGRR
jgi:hypothetical protein